MTGMMWMKNDSVLDQRLLDFMIGDDRELDAVLMPYDIRATAAHVRGLHAIGRLTDQERRALLNALDALLDDVRSGAFTLDDRFEDGHSALEAHLVERLGDLGKRVHLGRSRNDQVLVATRLFMKDALEEIRSHTARCAESSLRLASAHEFVPMPGYTHMQRAVPSTVGLWMASYAESFTDDAALLGSTIEWIDACPLGTAAGYGVNLNLPRDAVAKDLGFARTQINPMYAQASRGKFEAHALAVVWQFMQDLRRLGWDLTLFASAEFGFVTLPAEATTGSSIMPNKRNPDVAELLRAGASIVAGALAQIQNATSLPSGYHRDLQLTKGPLIRGLQSAMRAGGAASRVIDGLILHPEPMKSAIDPAMMATDRAVELAVSGTPFRDAYRTVAAEGHDVPPEAPEKSIHDRVSPGACADLRLAEIEARLRRLDTTATSGRNAARSFSERACPHRR